MKTPFPLPRTEYVKTVGARNITRYITSFEQTDPKLREGRFWIDYLNYATSTLFEKDFHKRVQDWIRANIYDQEDQAILFLHLSEW